MVFDGMCASSSSNVSSFRFLSLEVVYCLTGFIFLPEFLISASILIALPDRFVYTQTTWFPSGAMKAAPKKVFGRVLQFQCYPFISRTYKKAVITQHP